MSSKIKPKIVIVHRYPPEFELIPCPGLLDIIRKLSTEYHIIHFGMIWDKKPNPELRKYIESKEIPLKVNIESAFDKWFKTALYYLFLPYLLFKIRKEKPDIIICREIFPFVPSFLGLLKIPLIVEITDWWPSVILGSSNFGRKIADFIETSEVKYWNRLDLVAIAHSTFDRQLLLKRGLSDKKIKNINLPMYGGVYGPSDARKERKELGFSDKDFVVAMHGIIHKTKGYDKILKWWSKLTQLHPNWKLLFIGGTMGESWFNLLLNDLNLKNKVVRTGWISDQRKLNKYLNAADCLLATRRNTPDTWGNVPSALTHNLMTGKPTITTDLPAIRELVNNDKNGLLFEPDNYESFKNLLEYIEENPRKVKLMGKRGSKRIKDYYSASKEAKSYLGLLDRLIVKKSVGQE